MGYNMKRGNSPIPFRELGSSPVKQWKDKKASTKETEIKTVTPSINVQDIMKTEVFKPIKSESKDHFYKSGQPLVRDNTDISRHWSLNQPTKEEIKAFNFDSYTPGKGATLDYPKTDFRYSGSSGPGGVSPNMQFMIGGPGYKAAYNRGDMQTVRKTLDYHNAIIGGSVIARAAINAGPAIPPTLKVIKDIAINNPVPTSLLTAYGVSHGVDHIVKGYTEKAQTETTADVSKAVKKVTTESKYRRSDVDQEKIDKIDPTHGTKENKQIDMFIAYTKKYNPNWKPIYSKEAAAEGVRKVTNFPENRSIMKENLRKGGKDYDSDFELNMQRMNETLIQVPTDTL